MKRYKMQWVCAVCTAVLVVTSVVTPAHAASLDPGFSPKSSAVELVSLDTGETVYEKNADKRVVQASTTKIMTFIVASELMKDPKSTTVTIPAQVQQLLPDRSFVTVQLAVGERISAQDLMYCMLVPSGNDAAIALALAASGGHMDQFVQRMNQKAKDLGCTDTNYTNVFGDYSTKHYTTARDLEKVYRYARTLPLFQTITSSASYTVPATNFTAARHLVSSNKLLVKDSTYYYNACTGGKTGTSDQAGYCLASTAAKGGSSYLCIALGAPCVQNGQEITSNGAFDDSRQLYEWAFNSLKKQAVLQKSRVMGTVSVLQAEKHRQPVTVVPEQDYSAMLPADSKTTTKLSLPQSIAAPVKKGQKIGTADILYNGQKLETVNLVASADVSQYLPFYQQQWFRIALIAVSIAAAAAALLLLLRALRHRNRRGGFGGGRRGGYRPNRRRMRRRMKKNSYHTYR